MTLSGGRAHYGRAIGILTLDTRFPRIPGDVGNATSYPFPVTFKTVTGATVPRVVTEGDPALLHLFIDAARELEREGVRAITTSCGFLILFQDALADAVTVPVFTSSLMMVPFVHRMLGSHQTVGILTADDTALTERHLQAAGIDSISIAVAGMQDQPEFARVILRDAITLDPTQVTQEMIHVTQQLVAAHPEIGALVLECANMPPYSHALHVAIGLPVFDLYDFITFVHHAVVVQERFTTGFL
jgi:Asp/Glu/hydantoin racemase